MKLPFAHQAAGDADCINEIEPKVIETCSLGQMTLWRQLHSYSKTEGDWNELNSKHGKISAVTFLLQNHR